MSDSATAWLEQNGIRCERWSLTLSPSACASLKAENPERCKDCTAADNAQPLKKRKRGKVHAGAIMYEKSRTGKKVEETVTNKTGKRICEVPGCNEPHEARGKCKKHYMQEYNRSKAAGAKNKPQQKMRLDVPNIEPEEVGAGGVEKPSGGGMVTSAKTKNLDIDFTKDLSERDKELLQEVFETAAYQRRTPANEILFRLEELQRFQGRAANDLD